MESHGLHLSLENLIEGIKFHSSVGIFPPFSPSKEKIWASLHDQVFPLMREGILTPFYWCKMQILLGCITTAGWLRLLCVHLEYFVIMQPNQSRNTSFWPMCIISIISICDVYLSGIRNIHACMCTAASKTSRMNKRCSPKGCSTRCLFV